MKQENRPELIAGRYQLGESLGKGGMGVVYRATDRLYHQSLALKQINVTVSPMLAFAGVTDPREEEQRLALTNEFQLLASLRHPNIISVLDYGFDQQRQPFFTMNLLEKSTTIIEAAQNQRLETQIDLMGQLLQALAYLHRRGVLHRDLKPGNVLVTDHQVRVLDFGLAVSQEQVKDAAGTVGYVDPAVIQGLPAVPASDLYAVGVIAYEIWAGQLPFETNNLAGILFTDPDLSLLNLPEPVKAVVGKLLNKSPDRRYPDALATLEAFRTAAGLSPWPEDPLVRESFLQAAHFVGREAELEQLTRALKRAQDGQGGSAWLVGGESGVGKSRLLNELRIQALVQGIPVLRGQGISGSGKLFMTFNNALQRLALTLELTDLEAGVLQTIIPDLEMLLKKEIQPPPPLEGQANYQRLVLTVAEIFRRASQTPILFLLEDLHWALENQDLLTALNRVTAQTTLVIVASYRSEEAPGIPNIFPAMQVLPLSRLDTAGIAALSHSMLGKAGSQPEVVRFLQRETEGNAFFLVETVRALAEEAGQLEAIGQMTLPESIFPSGVQTVVNRRLAQVAPADQPLLHLAAVVGRKLDLSMLAAAAPDTDLEGWLVRGTNLAILEANEDQWQFAHDKLREGMLANIPQEKLIALHIRAAEVLERTYASLPAIQQPTTLAEDLATHWLGAGDGAKALPYCIAAGDKARAAYDNEAALGWYNQALKTLDQLNLEKETLFEPQRVSVHESMGEVLNLIGRYHEALEHYASARELLEDLDALDKMQRLADICRKTASVYEQRSEFDTAFEWLQKGLIILDEDQPSIGAAKILLLGAGIFYRQGKTTETESWCHRSLEAAAKIQTRQGQQCLAQTYYLLGNVSYETSDYSNAVEHCLESVNIYEKINDKAGQARVYNNLGNIYKKQGLWDKAGDSLNNSLTINQQIGYIQGQGFNANNLAEIYLLRGDLEKAKSLFQESNAIWKQLGAGFPDAVTLSNLAQVHIYQRNWEESKKALAQSQYLFNQLGAKGFLPELERRWSEYFLRIGDLDSALEHIQTSIKLALESEARMEVGLSKRILGDIYQTRGEYQNAENAYEESLEILKELNNEYEAAKVILSLAELQINLGTQKSDKEARERLIQAIHVFEKLGAKADLAKAKELEEILN